MALLKLFRCMDPRTMLEAASSELLLPRTERAAETDIFASPRVLLVLRQGGLRDDFLALAARRDVPGWFDPPICLFQDLHERLGHTDRTPCGDYERLVLISRLLREHAQHVFARIARPDAFVDAVERLFGELSAEGVSPGEFEAACQRREQRDSFEQARDRDLIGCYQEYLGVLRATDRRDGRDALVDSALAIRADDGAFSTRLGDRRVLHIVGLQDLRGGWNPLLEALRASAALDTIAIYTVASIDAALRAPADETAWIPPVTGPGTRLFVANAEAVEKRDGSRVACISAPDADREMDEIAQRVRALLEQGIAASQIAIVTRSARPAIDRMLGALARRGVPATARRRHAFAEIPVIRSVLSLFRVAAEGWIRHGLVELAEQPYFASTASDEAPARRLDATVLNFIGYRRRTAGLDDWVRAHEELLATAQAFEARRANGEEDERRSGDVPPRADRVAEALHAFRSFAGLAADLDRPRALLDWVQWLEIFLEKDPWRLERQVFRVPDSRFDVARIDAAGLHGLRRIMTQWSEALALWSGGQERLDVRAFEAQLREVLSGEIALWTPTRRGVQVLEALAASQRSFEHVFLIGLSGDTFPLRPQRSPVLDDGARRELVAAGLPLDTASDWESRERDLLRVLVSGARTTLTCSWPRADAEGRDLIPSPFAEEIVIAAAGDDAWQGLTTIERDALSEPAPGWRTGSTADGARTFVHAESALSLTVMPGSLVAATGFPFLAGDSARAHAIHAATIERVRRTGATSPWNGEITDAELLAWLNDERLGEQTHVWSATQLEGYAKCPWAWFSQRLLRLDDLDDPDLDVDPMVRGTVLHDALGRFYRAAGERIGGPVLLRSSHLAWAVGLARDAFHAAMDARDSMDWLGPPALRPTKRAELERMFVQYVHWEAEFGDAQHTGHHTRRQILRTGVTAHEHSFGADDPAADARDMLVTLGEVRFRLRGSIDRVETGIDDRVGAPHRYAAAVDYKSSVYSTPGMGKPQAWRDNVVLQIPLYAHALEQAEGVRVSRIEYRTIRKPAIVHSIGLVTIGKEGLREETDRRDQLERALAAAGQHVKLARTGQFPARPAPSCGCPPYCHAWDICRTRAEQSKGW